MTYRTNISMSNELKTRIDTYNKKYPGTPINLSKVAQSAVDEILKEVSI